MTEPDIEAQLEAVRRELEQILKKLNVSPERLDAVDSPLADSPLADSIRLLREQAKELLASMQRE